VALIVKVDDIGLSLAQNDRPASSLLGIRDPGTAQPGGGDSVLSPVTKGLGCGLVIGMPYFLKALSVVGTAAMLWVGGGIIIHGLEEFGFSGIGHAVHGVAEAAAHAIPAIAAAVEWLVGAAAAGVFGLVVGALLIPLVNNVAAPVVAKFRG
jgi:predicted DNA repair protein MutK